MKASVYLSSQVTGMAKNRKRYILYMIIFIVLISSLVLFLPIKTVLVMYDGKTKQAYGYAKLDQSTSFQIHYTHSIHLSAVIEMYQITRDKAILQTETAYRDFGIGMPNNALEEGEEFVIEDGVFKIKNMKRRFEKIDLRIGKVRAKHALFVGKQSLFLADVAGAGTWVTFRSETYTCWQLWKGVDVFEKHTRND